MKITIDEEKCVGSGGCVLEAPELFDLRDDDVAMVLDAEPVASLHDAAHRAAAACPAAAIHLSENGGAV